MRAFILVSLIMSVAAAPHCRPKGSAVGHGDGKFRSAWLSHHASHTKAHAHPAASHAPAATHPAASHMPATSSKPAPKPVSHPAAAPSPNPPAPKPSASKPSSSSPDSFAAAYLDPHNALRAKHNAKPLTWSNDLANAAKSWASRCHWAHSQGAVGNFGENIAAGTGNFDAHAAVSAWASEESQYNPQHPVFSHYTQMVWKGSSQLGCAVVSCPGLINSDVAKFHVCEYAAPGNVQGQFAQNVN